MPAIAEPTTAPQHSPHGEQDSAVLEPQVDTQEEQAVESSLAPAASSPAVETVNTVEPVAAAPSAMASMMAGAPAMAPMEGNQTAEEDPGMNAEQEPLAQEMASGDGAAPPADGDSGSAPPADTCSGGAGGSSGEDATEPEEGASEEATKETPETVGDGAAEAPAPAGPVHTTPRSPEEDPEFQATVARKDNTVAEQQQHEDPAVAAGAAQASSVSPSNERESMAEAGQVDEMEAEEPGVFDAASFKAMLMEAIAAILPKNNDEADDFADSGKVDEVKNQATSQVESEKESAAGNIEQKTQEEPDTSSVPQRQIQPLQPQDPGPPPIDIEASKAMPPKRGAAEVNAPLDQNVAEMDQTMADAEVTEEQLANSNEPAFAAALASKNEAKQHAEEAPVQFRQQEQETLAQSENNAQAAGEAQLTAMHQDRTGMMAQVSNDQQNTATQDTSARQKVADHINGLYEQTKTDVETILNNLDASVKTMFDKAADKATKAFESLVEKRMSAYKDERYSGLIGKGRWIKDLFAGLPDEVNEFFTEGRNLYLSIMDGELTTIAEHVATELTAAKDRIQKGKQDIQDYVVSLPKDLQQVGKDAADAINSKFDELTESVNAKGEELVDTIADMYKESLDAVDARIEEMKAANRGLIDMALGALIGVIETILKIKNLLFELLAAALEVIGTIITDPIGFLSNLIEGVKQGINNFITNILSNVMTGLIEWLTGSLGNVGIQMPENLFSLSGIFDLVTQMLGLTWDYFRDMAVRMLGEPVVAAMEKGLELFEIIRTEGVQGLWEHIKEQFTDLKEMVMDAIRDMIVTKVIEAGIKWVLGLLSPAGAFIKAAMLIIDIVKFFVERAAQIFELVQAFIEGIKAVASGNVSAVAKAIEKALVKAIPILIGFLAALVGVTGLTSKVQKIIKKVRKRIDKAIKKIIKKAKRVFGRGKKGKKVSKKDLKDDDKKSESQKEHDEKVDKGLDYLEKMESSKDRDNDRQLTEEEAEEVAKETKKKHKIFKSITPKLNGDKWDYEWRASKGTKKGKKKAKSSSQVTKLFGQIKDNIHDKVKTKAANAIKKIEAADLKEKDGRKKVKKIKTLMDRLKEFATIKKLRDKPFTNKAAYGDHTQQQAADAAVNALPSLSKQERADKVKNVIKDIEKSPTSMAYKSLRDQVLDKDKRQSVEQRLLSAMKDDDGEHKDYKIVASDLTFNGTTNGKLVVQYSYTVQQAGQPKETRSFEVTMEPKGNVIHHSIVGTNLGIKDPGRGETKSAVNATSRQALANAKGNPNNQIANIKAQGDSDKTRDGLEIDSADQRTGYQGSTHYGAQKTLKNDASGIKFNASHLIADWFNGSGYAQALNLVHTSEYYNKEVMGAIENSIVKELKIEQGKLIKKKPNGKYITFNATVSAEWQEIVDNAVASKVKGQTQAAVKATSAKQKEQILKDLVKDLGRSTNPKFCKSVRYVIGGVVLKDASGAPVPKAASNYKFDKKIGEDTHLKDIINKIK